MGVSVDRASYEGGSRALDELARVLREAASRHPQVIESIDLALVEKLCESLRANAAKNKAALPAPTAFTKRKIERLQAGYDGAILGFESAVKMARDLADPAGHIVTPHLIELLTASAGDLRIAAAAT
jgi:hypothetical protein